MLRRGSIVKCGPGYRGIGWPDCDTVRITSLAPWLVNGRIASHLTAAWVWGCALSPGELLSISIDAGRHPRNHADPLSRTYQLRLTPSDVTCVAALPVTTPLRTAYDLLHSPGDFSCAESLACKLLLTCAAGATEELRQRLLTERRPHSVLAKQRADWLF